MRLFDRLTRGSPKVTTPAVTRKDRLVPYEVVGKTSDGRRICEIVWVKGYWEARTVAAEMYRFSSRLLVQAYELLQDASGSIQYAANGRPIHTCE